MSRLVLALVLAAADWLSSSADPQRTRSQSAEKDLSPATVANLKLLWKFNFDERVTAPVVLGPIFTHRGIKELVFVAGAGDNLYAVDADLGRLFWKRHFDVPASDCTTGLTAAPVLAPYNGPAPEGDDASTPRRSLFVLTSDGQLHTVRPADAKDLALPLPFVPAGSNAADLALTSNVISTYVSNGCTNPRRGEWTIQLHNGTVAVQPKTISPKSATWNRFQITATGMSLRFNSPNSHTTVDGEVTFQPPVAANGLAFTVKANALAAFEIETAKQLFLSPASGTEPAQDSLAVANGHVYFVAGTTIYCYGFPIEI